MARFFAAAINQAPGLPGSHQSFLGKVFGQTDIADNTCKASDEFGCLDLPDRFDNAVGVGSVHRLRSQQS